MSVREGDVVPDLYGHSRRVGLEETVDQCCRCGLRRRSPASGRHQLLWRRNDRAAEHSQHFKLPNFLFSRFLALEISLSYKKTLIRSELFGFNWKVQSSDMGFRTKEDAFQFIGR